MLKWSGKVAVLIQIALFVFSLSAQTSVRLDPAIVERLLEEKLAADPGIPAASLADYGNKLAAVHGYSFGFDPTTFKESPVTVGTEKLGRYDLVPVGGGRPLAFLVPERIEHPCGTWNALPVLSASPRSLTVVGGGKTLDVSIPTEFVVDEMELVDATLKTVLRRWTVPMDSTPAAISPDGRRLFLFGPLDQIYLEVDESGKYRFAPVTTPSILKQGIDLKKFPKDKDNDYLGFRRFRNSRSVYTIKFSHPCT
jgi:hypothetical protein